jgi:hypothetical protein
MPHAAQVKVQVQPEDEVFSEHGVVLGARLPHPLLGKSIWANLGLCILGVLAVIALVWLTASIGLNHSRAREPLKEGEM